MVLRKKKNTHTHTKPIGKDLPYSLDCRLAGLFIKMNSGKTVFCKICETFHTKHLQTAGFNDLKMFFQGPECKICNLGKNFAI